MPRGGKDKRQNILISATTYIITPEHKRRRPIISYASYCELIARYVLQYFGEECNTAKPFGDLQVKEALRNE
jgi:hypothetical protein